MAQKKLFGKLSARQIIRLLSVLFILGTLVLLYQYETYFAFLTAPMVILSVVVTDYLHHQDSLRKKNPVKVQMAHFSQSVRAKIRHYFNR